MRLFNWKLLFRSNEENNYSYFEFTSTELDFPEYNIFRDDFSSGGEYYGFLLDSGLKKVIK